MRCLLAWACAGWLTLAPLAAEPLSRAEASKVSTRMRSELSSQYGPLQELSAEQQDQQAVGEVFANVARYTHRQDVAYRVSLLNDPSINAYALPDGQIVLCTGLVQALHDRDAIAFVTAHELTHVENDHATKKVVQGGILGALLIAFAGREDTWVQVAAGLSAALMSTGYARELEAEADREGMDLMTRAGYNPQGGLLTMKMFRDMEAHGSGLRIFPTHPAAEDRYRECLAWFEVNDYPLPPLALLDTEAPTEQLVARMEGQAQQLWSLVKERPARPGDGPARQSLLGLAESLNNYQRQMREGDPGAGETLRGLAPLADQFGTTQAALPLEGEERQQAQVLGSEAGQLERRLAVEQARRCDVLAQYLLQRTRKEAARKGTPGDDPSLRALLGLAEATHNHLEAVEKTGAASPAVLNALLRARSDFQMSADHLPLDSRYAPLVGSLAEELHFAEVAGPPDLSPPPPLR